MATSSRRIVTRQPSKSLKTTSNYADQLADDLATKLAIGNPESKLSAMRSVNSASQDLSRVIQSGWKKSSNCSKAMLQSTSSSASTAVKQVAVLRNLCPDDVDVERAAASILGKLVALEMFDLSRIALADMHPALCRLLNTETGLQASQDSLYFLSVPRPPSFPTDPVVLTLISTYLLHALIVNARPETTTINTLATALTSPSSTTLLAWVPSLTSLPTKHIDSLLTRAYTSLIKLTSSPSPNPKTRLKSTSAIDASPDSIFILRMYALRCLIHTSPGIIETNVVWDQVTRFTSTFVKAAASDISKEEKCTIIVLSAYSDLVQRAEKRPDRDAFMAIDQKGKGFLGFCECWMEFTKRTGDISVLQKINRLMRLDSSYSANFSLPQSPIPENSESSTSHIPDLRRKVLEASNFCNIFAQITVLLDDYETTKNDKGLLEAIREGMKILNTPTTITLFLQPPIQTSDKQTRDEEEFLRIGRKVDRALEKLRRSALKCIESTQSSVSVAVNSAIRELLLQSVACWQTCFTISPLKASMAKDTLTRTLDTLFILSRTILNVQDPRTFVPAFDYLSTAATILDSIPEDSFLAEPDNEIVDVANYTRCVSGAFYNVAGSLYQATRYGTAVPFLKESCALGSKALHLRRPVSKSKNEKEWQQLEEQLFRRWELLAVCYSKNGDRKNSYNALLQAIHTFPFFSSGLMAQCDTLAPDALFGQSAGSVVRQLVSLVDRVSYLGTCELLLPTQEVSLKSALNCSITPPTSHDGNNIAIVDPRIVGALLERQLDSLEPSRSKEGVRAVFVQLLRDVLDVYRVEDATSSQNGMPMRRARVLVRCMEFAYRDHDQDGWSAFGFINADEIGYEIERLVMMSDLGKDTLLTCYGTQYRIASRLWMALHTHRRADPEQNALMTRYADEACRLIKELLVSGAQSSPKATRKLWSPKALKKTSSPQARRLVSPKTTRTTRQRVPAAPRKVAPVKSKAALNPKTPNSKSRIAPQPVSFNTINTPPRRSLEPSSIKSTLVFDNFDNLLELLQLTARILGLLMLILPKAHVLDMARKLSQWQNGITSDGYVVASLDLAHEYVALGKMKRAVSIFNQALEVVRSGHASPEVAVRFLIRYSESLAMVEEVPKSATVYLEALEISSQVDLELKGMSTQQRIHARTRVLEMAAMASHTFAAIQYSKGDVVASLDSLLQSIRLWNRAADTIMRLHPSSRSQTTTTEEESDPFGMSSLKEALSSGNTSKEEQLTVKKNVNRRFTIDGLEWRISEGLLSTLFSLSRVYHLGGSAREAEYFAQQAADIAEELSLPAMISRALAKKGEVQLQMGKLEEAHANLARAEELLRGMPGIDAADVRRLKADYQQRTTQQEIEELEFAGTVTMLEDLDAAFRQFDNLAFGPRRSLVTSPRKKGISDVLAPDLLASVLCRQLWLLRDDVGDAFNALLEKFLSLSYSTYNKAEETALMAKLTLHSVYGRFRMDMFLSSLTESAIAVPMGMLRTGQCDWTLPSPDILDDLTNAEKLLWSQLNLMAQKGSVVKVREAAISLALVGAFQTSLGNQRNGVPLMMASLLDVSTALSLRRDMLVAIQHKIPLAGYLDDLEWPLLAENGAIPPRVTTSKSTRFNPTLSLSDSEDEEGSGDWLARDRVVETYWDSIRTKYQSQILDFSTLSSSRTAGLPANWTIITISVTHDNGTLFISRQEGGTKPTDPLIFCVPLNGRRDEGNGEDDDTQLSFEHAMDELQDIVRSSDESTKAAINIKPDDEEAKSNWWKQRGQLDVRMKELMENIEYCWLGAFKTVLNPRPKLSKDNIFELRGQFDKIFHRALHVKDPKPKKSHKKSVSQTPSPSHVMLNDVMVECFSTLSPKCRNEELEDLIYFILDLYQFHGVPVAIAEVDIDQVIVDLRMVLEENCVKKAKEKKFAQQVNVTEGSTETPSDEHLFLVLDKNVQGLPWESMPILRGRSVSRIPGVDFLHDRVAFAKLKREARGQIHKSEDGAAVDASCGYYILNPSGDLRRTEDRFRDWSEDMRKMGWDGVVGRPLTEQEFVNALRTRDLVVYFGHGGGEQYVRSHKIRALPTCAATMLWGCSSGALRELGDFDRTGTPYNYMLAGCPTLVANLWDVTDKDIDKFSQSVFDKLSLNSSMKEKKRSNNSTSIVAAVAQSRDSCKLKYLTGAAPVVYGIPFYL